MMQTTISISQVHLVDLLLLAQAVLYQPGALIFILRNLLRPARLFGATWAVEQAQISGIASEWSPPATSMLLADSAAISRSEAQHSPAWDPMTGSMRDILRPARCFPQKTAAGPV